MTDDELKVGMYVTISRNIEQTKLLCGVDGFMTRLAGDGKPRKITDIKSRIDQRSHHKKVAHVDGYVWMPSDLEIWEPDSSLDIAITGEKFQFDPTEL